MPCEDAMRFDHARPWWHSVGTLYRGRRPDAENRAATHRGGQRQAVGGSRRTGSRLGRLSATERGRSMTGERGHRRWPRWSD
jgi:hypothetical protein